MVSPLREGALTGYVQDAADISIVHATVMPTLDEPVAVSLCLRVPSYMAMKNLKWMRKHSTEMFKAATLTLQGRMLEEPLIVLRESHPDGDSTLWMAVMMVPKKKPSRSGEPLDFTTETFLSDYLSGV